MLTRVWAKRYTEECKPRVEQHISRSGTDSYYYINLNDIRCKLENRREAAKIIKHFEMVDVTEDVIEALEYEAWKNQKFTGVGGGEEMTKREIIGSAICIIGFFLAIGTAGAVERGVISLTQGIIQGIGCAVVAFVGVIICDMFN